MGLVMKKPDSCLQVATCTFFYILASLCRSSRWAFSFYWSLNTNETCFLGPYGPLREKTCLQRFANNKGADQPAHPRSLSSAFVICVLESTISKLATSEISIFLLVPVAEQATLNLTLSETLKTGFLVTRPI